MTEGGFNGDDLDQDVTFIPTSLLLLEPAILFNRNKHYYKHDIQEVAENLATGQMVNATGTFITKVLPFSL